jgi:hypothetical protein
MSAAKTRNPAEASSMQPTRQQLEELDALLKRMLDLPVHQLEEGAEFEEPAPAATTEASPGPETILEPITSTLQPGRTYPPSYMVVESIAPKPYDKDQEAGAQETENSRKMTSNPEVGSEKSPEGEWVPFKSSWQPSPHTWGPLADTWQQARSSAVTETVPEKRESSPAWFGTPDHPIISPPGQESNSDHEVHVEPSPMPISWMNSTDTEPTEHTVDEGSAAMSFRLIPLVAFNYAFDLGLLPLGPLGRWLRGPSGRALLGTLGTGCMLAALALAVADRFGWTR